MTGAETFTFGIPLVARSVAGDWPRVEALLALTLRSLAGQRDRDFRVILCGHDHPSIAPAVPFTFLQADWPVEAVRADNRDRGRKVQAINELVLSEGGGLLMMLDADDWVDARLVAEARVALGPDHLGAIVARGYAIDPVARRALPIPHPGAFEAGFDELCGSSVIARLAPAHADPLFRDPYAVLHAHDRFAAQALAKGAACRRLDVSGAYLVNTATNHSERHGPFASWRRDFNARVAAEGLVLDPRLLARFGLDDAALERDFPAV